MTRSSGKFQKWTVEIEMDETWIEDGFDITDRRMVETIQSAYGYIYGHEIRCKVLKRPPDDIVAKLMGFKTVDEYLKDRDK